ncbi:MAG: hypothetical protein ACJAWW_002319 [Sulfurimonas sp.]|jgi:hypothetical protein
MKKLLLITLCLSSLFAKDTFDKNIEYTCINTHNILKGQKMDVDPNEAIKQPFIFTIKEDKIYANHNIVLDFKMQQELMFSYSNDKYMLLLTPNLELGLVPKTSKGSVQYYFKCESK